MIQGLLVVTPCGLVHTVESVMGERVCVTESRDWWWVLMKMVVNTSMWGV